MKDLNLDKFDVYYLIRAIEEHILMLYDKKRGPSNDTKIEIQAGIWKKLLELVKSYETTNKKHRYVFDVNNIGEVDDGSHSFEELYHHRMILFSVICNTYKDKAWKSWKHHSGDMFEDYFIVGVETPEGQFTYHYHKDWWGKFEVTEMERAPEWDGHEAVDVIRLLSLIKNEDE